MNIEISIFNNITHIVVGPNMSRNMWMQIRFLKSVRSDGYLLVSAVRDHLTFLKDTFLGVVIYTI
jgi:hypothetical protein